MFSIGTPVESLGPETAPAAWPGSSGIAPGLAEQLIRAPYDRTDLLAEAISRHGDELAAVICEPVFFNAGCILPSPEFMRVMREQTQRHGVLLVFDEVQSAFRMVPGGAQQYLGITPDLCTVRQGRRRRIPAQRIRRPSRDHGTVNARGRLSA